MRGAVAAVLAAVAMLVAAVVVVLAAVVAVVAAVAVAVAAAEEVVAVALEPLPTSSRNSPNAQSSVSKLNAPRRRALLQISPLLAPLMNSIALPLTSLG